MTLGAVATGAANMLGSKLAEKLLDGGDRAGIGPFRGARLEYEVTMGGQTFRILMREPIGKWLDLEPVYPAYGTFKGMPGSGGTAAGKGNQGKTYTKRGGFRQKSYRVLLKPGTSLVVPKARASRLFTRNADTGTQIVKLGNFFIGCPNKVMVNHIIEWLKSTKRKSSIYGVVSPTGRKYQWGGVLHTAK